MIRYIIMGKFRRRTRRRNKSKKGTRMKGGGPPAETTFEYDTSYKLDEIIIKNITNGANGAHKWPNSIIEYNKSNTEYDSDGTYDLKKKFVDNYMQSCFRKLLENAGIDERHTHIIKHKRRRRC